jgi:hypothetical protein
MPNYNTAAGMCPEKTVKSGASGRQRRTVARTSRSVPIGRIGHGSRGEGRTKEFQREETLSQLSASACFWVKQSAGWLGSDSLSWNRARQRVGRGLSSLGMVIKGVELLPVLGCSVLERVNLRRAGATRHGCLGHGPQGIWINTEGAVRLRPHHRIRHGDRDVSILVGNAAQSQGDGIGAHWPERTKWLNTKARLPHRRASR